MQNNFTNYLTKFNNFILPKEDMRESSFLIFYDIIILNLKSSHELQNIIGLNLDKYQIDSITKQKINLTKLYLFKNKESENEDNSSIPIKITENLSKFKGSICDLIFINSCLEYMLYPMNIIQNALEIAPKVLIRMNNYGNFKYRLRHFKGSLDLDKEWYNSGIIHPFSIEDFIQMCEEKHFVIEDTYFYKNDEIKNIKNISIFPNLIMHNATFLISKL